MKCFWGLGGKYLGGNGGGGDCCDMLLKDCLIRKHLFTAGINAQEYE